MSNLDSEQLARKIIQFALAKKAQDISLLNLRPLTAVSDFFIICHGDADVHVKAIADGILDGLAREGIKVWHREGYDYLNWVLLDFVDVVVHVFQKETRDYYGLERLWGDAEMETFTE